MHMQASEKKGIIRGRISFSCCTLSPANGFLVFGLLPCSIGDQGDGNDVHAPPPLLLLAASDRFPLLCHYGNIPLLLLRVCTGAPAEKGRGRRSPPSQRGRTRSEPRYVRAQKESRLPLSVGAINSLIRNSISFE